MESLKQTFQSTIMTSCLVICLLFHNACTAQDNQKAVLITGATSGIGLKMTELLSSEGFFVYAGARKQADIDRLNAMDNVMAVKIDVTKQDQIDAAVQTVANEGRGLYGLVNNAGVGVLGPMIEFNDDDLNWMFDININGPYRVTKAFAPMIIESQGRITTTGSIAGILSSKFFGPYSMTKHAVEAFADALAVEMAQFGVSVSVIEPGGYDTRIGDKVMEKLQEDPEFMANSRYREEMENMVKNWNAGPEGKAPDEVAQALLEFMTTDTPKRRYMVVPNEGQGTATVKKAMQETIQLNANQAYKLDREALIQMMDELMAAENESKE